MKFHQIIKFFSIFIIVPLLVTSCENKTKELPASEVYINMPDDGYEIEVFDTIIISPKITYDYSSNYSWELDGQVISNEKDYTLIPNILRSYTFTFSFSNDRGSQSINIYAQSIINNNIEDLVINTDTFGVNADSDSFFISKQLKFGYSGIPLYESFSGFAYSNLSGNFNSENIKQVYSSYKLPSGAKKNNFVVMKQTDNIPVSVQTIDGEDHLFKSLVVNNTYNNYQIIKNGSDNSKAFGGSDGTDTDWFKLTIKGYSKSGAQTGLIEFDLANYTAKSNKDDYIITDWKTVDLTSIGKANKLEFSLSSSDTLNDKMNTPAFACIDDIKIIE